MFSSEMSVHVITIDNTWLTVGLFFFSTNKIDLQYDLNVLESDVRHNAIIQFDMTDGIHVYFRLLRK